MKAVALLLCAIPLSCAQPRASVGRGIGSIELDVASGNVFATAMFFSKATVEPGDQDPVYMGRYTPAGWITYDLDIRTGLCRGAGTLPGLGGQFLLETLDIGATLGYQSGGTQITMLRRQGDPILYTVSPPLPDDQTLSLDTLYDVEFSGAESFEPMVWAEALPMPPVLQVTRTGRLLSWVPGGVDDLYFFFTSGEVTVACRARDDGSFEVPIIAPAAGTMEVHASRRATHILGDGVVRLHGTTVTRSPYDVTD